MLGVEDAVIALGSESDFLIIRSWKSGRIISRMRRGAFRQQFGAPNLTVHRADLLDVLRRALKRGRDPNSLLAPPPHQSKTRQARHPAS